VVRCRCQCSAAAALVDVVEVAKPEQDVVDRLVGIFRLEAFEEER